MLKWILIACVVLLGFSAVLLGLGRLLLDNKENTTLLKQELDQALLQQQYLNQQKLERKKINQHQPLSSSQQSFKDIISSHSACSTKNDCILFETHNKPIGCTVAINLIGASVLIKINTSISENMRPTFSYPQNTVECVDDLSVLTADCVEKNCVIIY